MIIDAWMQCYSVRQSDPSGFCEIKRSTRRSASRPRANSQRVSTSEATIAEFSAPASAPATSAFLQSRAIEGLLVEPHRS